MNFVEIIQKWVITKNWAYTRMNVLKFLLLYIVIIINSFFFLQKSLNLPIILQVCCYLLLTNITFIRIIKIRKVNLTSLIQMRAKSSCLTLNQLFTKYQDNNVIHLRSDFFLTLSTYYRLHV